MRATVLLFDIDGTLITSGGAGRRAMLRALADDGLSDGARFRFAGMTDRLIVRTALREAAVAISEERIDRIIARYLTHLAESVLETPEGDYRVHPGVRAAIRQGRERGFAVGLGTGNVEAGARIKLSRVELDRSFPFGGFGSDAEDRRALIRRGAERGATRLGAPLEACRVVVLGDTPRDIEAARALAEVAPGAESFAVTTGFFGAEELAQHEPDHLFPDLAAPGALAALLDGA